MSVIKSQGKQLRCLNQVTSTKQYNVRLFHRCDDDDDGDDDDDDDNDDDDDDEKDENDENNDGHHRHHLNHSGIKMKCQLAPRQATEAPQSSH